MDLLLLIAGGLMLVFFVLALADGDFMAWPLVILLVCGIMVYFLWQLPPTHTETTIQTDNYKFGSINVPFSKVVKIKKFDTEYPMTICRDTTTYKVEVNSGE